jgi:3-oxoacyl-[acyl-carrier protein] reductase
VRHDGTAPRARIVTIGSIAAFKGRTNGSIYATAKAGAIHFTRCLADQMRPHEVTVNTIAPGDTRTERFVNTRAVDPARLAEGGTLDRIATVDEVARVVELFAGPMGAFVSGQVLRVDGGGQLWAASPAFQSNAPGRGNFWQSTRLIPSGRKRAFTRWMKRDLPDGNG